MCKYGESKTAQIMMATVPHVTAWVGCTKYQADGFLFDGVLHWFLWDSLYTIQQFVQHKLYKPVDSVQSGLTCSTAVGWDCVPFMNERCVDFQLSGDVFMAKIWLFLQPLHPHFLFLFPFSSCIILWNTDRHFAADVFPWPQQLSTWCSYLLHNCMESIGSVFFCCARQTNFWPPTPLHLPFSSICLHIAPTVFGQDL